MYRREAKIEFIFDMELSALMVVLFELRRTSFRDANVRVEVFCASFIHQSVLEEGRVTKSMASCSLTGRGFP